MPSKIPKETTSCPDCGADVIELHRPVTGPTVAHAFFRSPPLLLDAQKIPAVIPQGRDRRDARIAEVYRPHRCSKKLPKQVTTTRQAINRLRSRYPVPAEHQRLGSWCHECGPNVTVDEDGLCSGCGATAIGPFADDAIRALRFVTQHDDHRAHFINWLRSHPLVEDEDGAPYPPAFFDHVAMWLEDHRDLPEGPEKG